MEPSAAKYEEGSSWSTHQPTSSPPEWVVDIRNHLKEKHLHINNAGERCSLSRVPPSMRQIDEDNYIPELVSIGPFHRDNPSLQSMEAHKLRFLYGILDPMTYKTNTVDSSSKNWRVKNVTLDGLERAMKELEKKTRECYSEKFDAFTSDEFVRMMVLDSCFIVELLRLYAMINQEDDIDDPILSTRFMLRIIRLDLLMLENQLPLFVLHRMFMLTGPDQDETSFNSLAINFFKSLGSGSKEKAISEYYGIHLLALFHSGFITNQTHPPCSALNFSLEDPAVCLPKTYWFSSATVLRCAGISFRKKTGPLLDIRFVNQVLEIPSFNMRNTMIKLSRNAVAYEQCNRSAKPYFTTLVFFFKILVNSTRDIELLRKEGIIQTLNSNEKAANDIHKLAKGIKGGVSECYIPEVIEEINQFTKARWNFWKATLKLYYFVNQEPINLLLFYFTIIQVISSLYQIVFDGLKSKCS